MSSVSLTPTQQAILTRRTKGADRMVRRRHGRRPRRYPPLPRQIGRQASKDYGIPRGMAYLTGLVIHCAIAEEQEAV